MPAHDLSPTMIDQLRRIASGAWAGVPFRTGEALRRRGLAARLSTFETRAEWVTATRVVDQGWRAQWRHEWSPTQAGTELVNSLDAEVFAEAWKGFARA